MKMVNHTPDTLPPFTEARKRNLTHLNSLSDKRTDTDDLPELTGAQMTKMERGRFYRPLKRQITARPDADVLAWLKSQGKEYELIEVPYLEDHNNKSTGASR